MYFSGSNLEGCVWAGFRGWVDQGDIIKTGSKTHVRRERTMSFVYSVKFICEAVPGWPVPAKVGEPLLEQGLCRGLEGGFILNVLDYAAHAGKRPFHPD